MAKKRAVTTLKPKTHGPAQLRMNLFEPGMSILHRAGLGGLACTLDYINRARSLGILDDDDLPGDWSSNQSPWEVDEQTITLNFGQPGAARVYLERLFRIAFDLKDGLIYLPGQYAQEPSLAVRAELQLGMTLTFLQHGKVRQLDKNATVVQYDPEGSGTALATVEYKRCLSYKHQDGWKDICEKTGCLSLKPVKVVGPLSPGTMVRHEKYSNETKIVDTAELILPLYFALIGCIGLPVNRRVGSLVVPDVENLSQFIVDRPQMTPTTVPECRVAENSDAVMQAKVRLKNRGIVHRKAMPSFLATTFKPTPWASQQKSRTWTMDHSREALRQPKDSTGEDDKRRLEQFEIALAVLPPQVRTKREAVSRKVAGKKLSHEIEVAFWSDSVVRALAAENLARDLPWYTNFITLMRDEDANGNPYRYRLATEREGLRAMIQHVSCDYEPERILVNAIHQAIRWRMAQIRTDTDGKDASGVSQATKNRWNRFREELRLNLVGAKTADQTRAAICQLFGRAGSNEVLQQQWQEIIPLVTDAKYWKTARDLGLLALASYASSERQPQED
ncbi:type I-MYXAN CRISPR-associated Cas8a1/Cmx1 [Rubinisphaera margarita]|uniref:type I-MYXAN CRISPR-associated Cas8a1/Cmx1 n=1 Tax=Rubinisphaera margarita TaxID=2909586 RepID=UPI001EE7ED6B|nr:type I-MYXAN CRISPR-associated Cas8a1/Cmx1 [Rubinisphaera margarita]MCG6157254.1 type I-MYXAN CRISPR-associated Cas8a1/Cmx1 [Rubinisphaera margarita]